MVPEVRAQVFFHRSQKADFSVICFPVHTLKVVVQVDGVLMSHPQVAEAVAFGCPDEKYGEIVAAAIVPNKPISDTAAFAKDLQKQSGQKMAAFKVLPQIMACDFHNAAISHVW